jgi:hypothetical protein
MQPDWETKSSKEANSSERVIAEIVPENWIFF